MDLEKNNNTAELIGTPSVNSAAVTGAIGTMGVYGGANATIFHASNSAFVNGASPVRQTKLGNMGDYCEDAYDWMKKYQADCKHDNTAKKDTWECKKAMAMRKALNRYRFSHGSWAANAGTANPGSYRWFALTPAAKNT